MLYRPAYLELIVLPSKLTSNCQALNYLLMNYATVDIIAEADVEIVHLKQLENQNAVQYSPALRMKALWYRPVDDEYRLKEIFMKNLRLSICRSLQDAFCERMAVNLQGPKAVAFGSRMKKHQFKSFQDTHFSRPAYNQAELLPRLDFRQDWDRRMCIAVIEATTWTSSCLKIWQLDGVRNRRDTQAATAAEHFRTDRSRLQSTRNRPDIHSFDGSDGLL